MSGRDRLDRYFRELAGRDAFSGAVLITQGSARRFVGAYGFASRAWRVENTIDVRFDTASITKLFTAVATLQMIDQGRVAFDTRVVEFLNLENTNLPRDVNVFHLLTHSSGIGDDADEEAGESYEALWRTRPNYAVTRTPDLIAQCVGRPPNFPPGQGCRYCNCGYVFLGLVIEKASGLTYRDYVRKNVFARARMTRSDFFHLGEVHDDVAEGCDPILDEAGSISGWKRNIYSFPPIGSPDGGAFVTVGDLDRFLRSVKSGELLSPECTTAFFSPQVWHRSKAGGAEHFGYGLAFLLDENHRVVFFGKGGINPGVSGAIRHYPDDDVNVVILSNMENSAWKPLAEIHDMVVAGQFKE